MQASKAQQNKWQVTSFMNKTFHPGDLARAAPMGGEIDPDPRPKYLRCMRAAQLYVTLPKLGALTIARPHSGETLLNYFNRLRISAIPEEAITLAAFAPLPQLSIWWGHECLRLMPAALSGEDAKLLEQIGRWVVAPNAHLGGWIADRANRADPVTPTVRLGRATGWSRAGQTPAHSPHNLHSRGPSEINTAVLSTLAKAPIAHRAEFRKHILDLADCLFRAY